MQLITFSTLALFATSALAADCLGGTDGVVSKVRDAYWDARQKMCSNSDCAHQQACITQGTARWVLELHNKSGPQFREYTINVFLNRKNTGGQKGFKDCWDATKNIITQCVDGQNKLIGTWEYNGQLYQFDAQITTRSW